MADISELAAKFIHTAGESEQHHRILVYGRNKVGKTSFCASAGNVLIIDPEGGAEASAHGHDVWTITQWTDIEDVRKFLRTSEAQSKYGWVAFDGLTRIQAMALSFAMKQSEERELDRIPGLVQQRDYGKAGELVKGLLWQLQALPYNVIYTAQERMEEAGSFDDESDGGPVRRVPDLPKGARSAVNSIVDVIGRIYIARTEKDDGKVVRQRRLYIGPHTDLDTGCRSVGKVPKSIANPTVDKLLNTINNATENK